MDEEGAWFEVSGQKCFCNKDIDKELLEKILPNEVLKKGLFYNSRYESIRNTSIDELLEKLNLAFKKFEINNCLEKVHFLAQVGFECHRFRTTEEYGYSDPPDYWYDYEGGPKYHGRGLIQLTNDFNYKNFGDYIGIDLLANPSLVASNLKYAILASVWYWRYGSAWGDINKFANEDDLHYVTIAVNGGFNHYCKRKEVLKEILAYMDIAETCISVEPDKEIGTYSIETSGLQQTNNGIPIWNSYKNSPEDRQYIACEL